MDIFKKSVSSYWEGSQVRPPCSVRYYLLIFMKILRFFEIFGIIFGIFEISLIFGGSVNWGQVSIKLSIRPLQVSGWPLVRFLTLSFDFFTFSKLVSKFFLKFWISNFRELEFNRKEVFRVDHLVIKNGFWTFQIMSLVKHSRIQNFRYYFYIKYEHRND